MDWGDWVAISALVFSVTLALLNWAHSEKLFRRRHYPAIAWHCPEASAGERGTRVTSKIVNLGPRDILSVSFACFLTRGLKREAWCQALVDQVSANEDCVFNLTDTLEDDIKERFGGLYDEHGWRFRGKPKCLRVALKLSYVPALAEADRVTRKMYCRLVPLVKEETVREWHFHLHSLWRRLLPF